MHARKLVTLLECADTRKKKTKRKVDTVEEEHEDCYEVYISSIKTSETRKDSPYEGGHELIEFKGSRSVKI